jgi:hypothetical protein
MNSKRTLTNSKVNQRRLCERKKTTQDMKEAFNKDMEPSEKNQTETLEIKVP